MRVRVYAGADPLTKRQLRYQLLHTAARIVRGQRRVRIKIDTSWPWATHLAAAFARLTGIRQPLVT